MQTRNPGGLSNGSLSSQGFRSAIKIAPEALSLWEAALQQRKLTGRGSERVLRVAQTICDLDARPMIDQTSIAEAIGYRSFDLNVP
jgi:magnesium chelatase family protein